MGKETVYIVFDKLPGLQSGGLILTYINLVNLLKDKYEFKIVSIFQTDEDNLKSFIENEIIIINKFHISLKFNFFLKSIKEHDVKNFIWLFFSSVIYIVSIPYNRLKTRKLLKMSDKFIVASPSSALFLSKKIPYILEIHSKYDYFFNGSLISKFQVKIMNRPSIILYRTKSDAQKDLVNNSSYIYNFINENNFNDKMPNIIQGINKKNILFVGRLHMVKNPFRMIEIMKIIYKYDKEVTLDIYGDGPLFNDLEKAIVENKLQGVINLKGFTNDKNIYKDYSLFWLTSESEGFPMTILESKFCGIPTISTQWGDGVYEIIKNDEDGFITEDNNEFAKKSLELLNNDKMLLLFSNNAKNNYEKYFGSKQKKKEWIELLEKRR